MPGPMSAPNGDYSLVNLKNRADSANIKTGKTALKKGNIEHVRETKIRKALTRKQRENQEES